MRGLFYPPTPGWNVAGGLFFIFIPVCINNNVTHYETLGISPKATAEEIRKAYRNLALKYHPDRNPGDDIAPEKFKSVQSAYDVLSDLNSKARYDLTMPKPKPAPPVEPIVRMKTKAQREAEAYAAYRAEVARGFTIGDAPPPKFDLWGKPINNRVKKEPEFVDAFANSYSSDVPDIR